MVVYDSAVKIIFSRCKDVALEYFLGLDVEESEVIELSQETVSLRRADIPMRVETMQNRLSKKVSHVFYLSFLSRREGWSYLMMRRLFLAKLLLIKAKRQIF